MRSSRSNLLTNSNFTGGTEIDKGDHFWQPKSVRGDQNFHYSSFTRIHHKTSSWSMMKASLLSTAEEVVGYGGRVLPD